MMTCTIFAINRSADLADEPISMKTFFSKFILSKLTWDGWPVGLGRTWIGIFGLGPVWPDLAIYTTLGKFLKPLATIKLPKSPTFLGNFCKGVKIYYFSSEIIFRQLVLMFGDFFWSHWSRAASSFRSLSTFFLFLLFQVLLRLIRPDNNTHPIEGIITVVRCSQRYKGDINDHTTNWATTTAHNILILLLSISLSLLWSVFDPFLSFFSSFIFAFARITLTMAEETWIWCA